MNMIVTMAISDAQIKEHLINLPPNDRYSRFCCVASDSFIENYVDNARGFFFGILLPDFSRPLKTTCVGLLHVVLNHETSLLEIAISVDEKFRGHGFGKTLLEYGISLGEFYRAKGIIISGISSNKGMISLAKSYGFSLSNEYGEFNGKYETIGSNISTIVENNLKLLKILNSPQITKN